MEREREDDRTERERAFGFGHVSRPGGRCPLVVGEGRVSMEEGGRVAMAMRSVWEGRGAGG